LRGMQARPYRTRRAGIHARGIPGRCRSNRLIPPNPQSPLLRMFESLRQSLRDLIESATPPEERRAVFARMKDTLVQYRVGIEDMRSAAELTRKRLAHERRELETIRRRKGLAAGIEDAETVRIAEQYETQHAERVAVLERKLEAQQDEVALAEREVQAMTAELKAAIAGAGSLGTPGVASAASAAAAEDPLRDDLRADLDGLARAQRRASADSDAEARLEALKRRMGK